MSDHSDAVATYGTGKKTLKSYLIGLGLSLIFTIIAFYIVGNHSFSSKVLFFTLGILALSQFLAQVIFFLRFNMSPEGRWNVMAFVFVLVIIAILVGGTMWIMYNLNYNMMH